LSPQVSHVAATTGPSSVLHGRRTRHGFRERRNQERRHGAVDRQRGERHRRPPRPWGGVPDRRQAPDREAEQQHAAADLRQRGQDEEQERKAGRAEKTVHHVGRRIAAIIAFSPALRRTFPRETL
jgi:hypothetical protein